MRLLRKKRHAVQFYCGCLVVPNDRGAWWFIPCPMHYPEAVN